MSPDLSSRNKAQKMGLGGVGAVKIFLMCEFEVENPPTPPDSAEK